jgi:hypothetical protein
MIGISYDAIHAADADALGFLVFADTLSALDWIDSVGAAAL